MTTSTPPDQTASSIPSGPATIDGLADQIRQLATQLNQPPYNFDPTTIRKANIVSIDAGDGSTPPTATILFSGDTTSPVAGVRLAAGYGPQVGDTVIVLKQAADFFILTDIVGVSSQTASSPAGGWTQATLNGSHSHGGNSNGNLMFRRTMDNGCWKMQWKGAITYGGTTTVLSAGLGTDFRPSTKVSMASAREVASAGGVSVGIDFNTDGTVTIVAPTWSTSQPSSGSTNSAGTGHNHSHNDFYGASGEFNAGGVTSTDGGSHTHTIGHTHSASNPSWISFHGVEYFLG